MRKDGVRKCSHIGPHGPLGSGPSVMSAVSSVAWSAVEMLVAACGKVYSRTAINSALQSVMLKSLQTLKYCPVHLSS